jgi:hypothetical protein
MLSLSDIESFFCNILQFPDWKKHLDKDKLEFLKEVVQRETYYCYFQVKKANGSFSYVILDKHFINCVNVSINRISL